MTNPIQIPEISAEETHTLWKTPPPNWKLIDVRERDEYETKHISKSEWIPLSDFINQSTHLNSKSTYVIYCKSGQRSASVTAYLLENGFTSVKNMSGGLLAWEKKGFELNKKENGSGD